MTPLLGSYDPALRYVPWLARWEIDETSCDDTCLVRRLRCSYIRHWGHTLSRS